MARWMFDYPVLAELRAQRRFLKGAITDDHLKLAAQVWRNLARELLAKQVERGFSLGFV
jgi:propanediol dehydratase small subunit